MNERFTRGDHHITQLLVKWGSGDKAALDELIPLVYDELRKLAASYLRRRSGSNTQQATALVHEAYVRLADQSSISMGLLLSDMNTPESMQQLEELFHEALELKQPERPDFITRLRTSNPDLGAAVESLIAAHEGPHHLVDAPAVEAAAEIIVDPTPALAAGQVVGHYQIIKPLGKGGMGEVYLANDAKLGRQVALKLLPAEFTNHKERLRRFDYWAAFTMQGEWR